MAIKRIVVFDNGKDGQAAPRTVYEAKSDARKVSRFLRPAEKAGRRMLEAQVSFAETLLDRHDRSSRRRKDKWISDAPNNAMKAGRKAFKRLVKL